MVSAVENFSELRIGVLTIFAEAQAWAHDTLHSVLAERAALSALAHNRGRKTKQKPRTLSTSTGAVRNRAWRARQKKAGLAA